MVKYPMSLLIGHAAEAFAIYRLCTWGYTVSQAPQHSHYDLIVDVNYDLIRLQVKGAAGVSANGKRTSFSYKFDKCKGRNNRTPYADNDLDLFCFVALPHRLCLFELPDGKLSASKSQYLFTEINERETWDDTIKQLRRNARR